MTNSKTALFGAAAAVAFFGVAPQSAWAQSGPQAHDGGIPQLEEVVVQARRSEESQQSVPVAVSTVTSERLIEASVGGVLEIQRLVPSLQIKYGPTGQTDFLIRGTFQGYGSDPAVVTYIDEVPIDSRILPYDIYDLGSVQQLKGPQGTLFGRNSTGGAVLFFSQKPELSRFGGYVSARYGRFDERRIEAAVNLPVGETMALRLSGQLQRRDGTVKSVTRPGLDFNDRDNYAIRASLLWRPNDAIENITRVSFSRVDESRSPRQPIAIAGPCTAPTTPALSCVFSPPFNALFGADNLMGYAQQQIALPRNRAVQDNANHDKVKRDAITNTLTIGWGDLNLHNVTYYAETDLLFGMNYDGTPARVFDAYAQRTMKNFYNETQLYGETLAGKLEWRVGGVFSSDREASFVYSQVFPPLLRQFTPQFRNENPKFKSYALFAQGTYDLSDFVDGLSFTAGYRYTWDRRKVSTRNVGGQFETPICQLQNFPITNPPTYFSNTDPATCTRRIALKSADANYNFTLSWQASDSILLYAATRRGYQAASYNATPPPGSNSDKLVTYAPQVIKDIEIGLKSDFRLGPVPVRANLAAFDAWYTDIQVSQTYIDPATGYIATAVGNTNPLTGASNKAEIYGFEVELTAAPTQWLTISGFYSRVWGTFKRYTTLAGLDLSGEHVGDIVPRTYGVSATADIPLSGPAESLGATLSYYKSAAPLTNRATTIIQPGSSSVDGRLELRNIFNSSVNLAVFGKNLADKRACDFNPVVSGLVTRRCLDPRTYGVEIRYRFGD